MLQPNNNKPSDVIFDISDAYDNFDDDFDIDEIIHKIKNMGMKIGAHSHSHFLMTSLNKKNLIE